MKPSNRSRPRRTLRSLIIEPFRQVKLGIYVIAISCAFVVVASLLFVSAFVDQYRQLMEIFKIVDPQYKWELVTNDVFKWNATCIAGLFLAFIGILFGVVLRMTHRIYGPLVSIERFVGEMSNGNYGKRIVIRSGDELQRLVHRLNDMAKKLEQRHGRPSEDTTPIHLSGDDAVDDLTELAS